MALKAKYKISDLNKDLKALVPKSRLQEARKFAAQFGVKKGVVGTKGQADTLAFVKAMKEKHLLKSNLGTMTTYGSTNKEILEQVTGTAVSRPDAQVAAHEERLARKEQIAAELEKRSSAERQASRPKDRPEDEKKDKPLTKLQKAENVAAGQESAKMAEEERVKHSGKKAALPSVGQAKNALERSSGVALAPGAVPVPRHEAPAASPSAPLPSFASPSRPAGKNPPAPPESAPPAASSAPAASPEPAKASEAVDIDIG